MSVAFEIHQLENFVLCGERFVAASLVLGNANRSMASNADVEDARLAGADVDVVDAVRVVHFISLRRSLRGDDGHGGV